MTINKQDKLLELQELKRQYENKLEFLYKTVEDIQNLSTRFNQYPSFITGFNQYPSYTNHTALDHLKQKIKIYKTLLNNIETEIKKIESMSDAKAKVYLIKDCLLVGLSKGVHIISDMTPKHIEGRVYSVSDNFLKYWLIFIAIVLLIAIITGVLPLNLE